jgi:hypothetical protein
MFRPLQRLTFGVLILVGSGVGATIATTWDRGFTAYVRPAFPHSARGDFDGDGRPDVAVIQKGTDDSYVHVRLSGSPDAALLEAKVISVVAADIDHDGDLDLVAMAPSGTLMVWLNDGRGRYALQEALHDLKQVSSAPMVTNSLTNDPIALGTSSPTVAPPGRSDTAVVVTQIRPPTNPPAFALSFLSLPSLRAPPLAVLL